MFLGLPLAIVWRLSQGIFCQLFLVSRPRLPVKMVSRQLRSINLLLWGKFSGSLEAVTNALGGDKVPIAALSGNWRVNSRSKDELFKLSREERPNPVPASGADEGGWGYAKTSALGYFDCYWSRKSSNLLENYHNFNCMICRMNVSMR